MQSNRACCACCAKRRVRELARITGCRCPDFQTSGSIRPRPSTPQQTCEYLLQNGRFFSLLGVGGGRARNHVEEGVGRWRRLHF